MKSLLYTLESNIAQNFWFLHPDVHERYRYIASLIPDHSTVLDVGGEQRVLEQILPLAEYVTVNVDPDVAGVHTHHQTTSKDLVYDGKTLPFDDNQFAVLLCVDVLEHVPKQERFSLIKEMLRVTEKKLIISAPYGSPEHLSQEAALAAELETAGHDVAFLREHVAVGLPQPSEIERWQERLGGQVRYSGNFERSAALLKFQLSAASTDVLNHLLFFIKHGLYFLANLTLYPFLFSKKPRAKTNRFYLWVDKR